MISGETVIVHRKVETGKDPFNNPVVETVTEPVKEVLVSPGPRADIDGSTRPAGVEVNWTLHFPKTFLGDLQGATISVRGSEPLRVIGAPGRYTAANTPGRWNMPVEVGTVRG